MLFFFREPGNEGTCTSGGEKIELMGKYNRWNNTVENNKDITTNENDILHNHFS